MHNNSNIEIENLEIYKKIVEHMNESLWIWNKNKKSIYVNNIFCELTWYNYQEIIDKDYSIFFHTSIFEENKINNWNIKFESTIYTKNWEKIPVLCSWTKTENWWIVLMINDLRELKILRKAKKDLEKLNKTKDEFISIVWHELRTPLTSIRWYLSMILDWDMWEINNEIKKSLNHSYESSVRLIKLVNDILSIWKLETWKMEYHMNNIEIKEIIHSVYNDIKLEMEKKSINFVLDFEEWLEKEYIFVDKDKLKQIFLNLLTNSLKFTNSWWKIKLKWTKVWKKARFEIIDNWIWIPKEKISSLFSKFSQVESSMQRQNDSWLWLWLALCKNYIKKFNSEIKVESELWKWSIFFFDLEIK